MNREKYISLNKIKVSYPIDMFISIYRKMCLCRSFENKVSEVYKQGLISSPVYLSAGQEAIPASLSEVFKGFYLFAQHRSHSTYLSFGGDINRLIDELLGLDSGCNGGKGGSAMVRDPNINMIGHHGLIGENVPLATGFSLASKENTICFFGDGSAEEDYVGASMGFAATHKLPVLFVCADNGLSVLTETKVRRNWEIVDVARAYGLNTIDICDDPGTILYYAEDLRMPAFLNIRTNRIFWHVGVGVDNNHDWDRLILFGHELLSMGVNITQIESEEYDKVKILWELHLQKLSKK